MRNTPIQYVANLSHVREVSLLGAADLGFWAERLNKEDLVPIEQDGKAQIQIIAAEAKFKGVRFSEVSFSVLVSRPEEAGRGDAAFLIGAFNSSRFFAFCERVFFLTPYDHGDVRVSASFPPAIQLVEGSEVVFRAETSAAARDPSTNGEDGWEGPVFLPGKDGRGRLFFAKIDGHTRTYPFLDTEDSVSISPPRDGQVLQSLVDSHFAGKTWSVREDAGHAKLKTYKRSQVLSGR